MKPGSAFVAVAEWLWYPRLKQWCHKVVELATLPVWLQVLQGWPGAVSGKHWECSERDGCAVFRCARWLFCYRCCYMVMGKNGHPL